MAGRQIKGEGGRRHRLLTPHDLAGLQTGGGAVDASAFATAGQGAKADSAVQSIVAGSGIDVDSSDPQHPVVIALGGGSGGSPSAVDIEAGSSYTLALTNAPAISSYKGIIVIDTTSDNTLIIPKNASVAFPLGTEIEIINKGLGQTTINVESGVNLYGPAPVSSGQNSSGKIRKTGSDLWFVSGEIPWVVNSDPYFANVVSLMHFDAVSGSTAIVDQISSNVWTCVGTVSQSNTQSKFGGTSLGCPTASTSNKLSGPTTLSAFAGDFTVEFWAYPITNSTSFQGSFFNVDRTSGPRGVQITWLDAVTVRASVAGGTSVDCTGLVENAWNYIALSVIGTTAYLTVNSTLSVGTWTVGQGNTTNPMTFFTHGDGVTNMIGYIDEFRLTKGVGRYNSLAPTPTGPFPNG